MFSVKQNKNYFSKTFINILSTINYEEVFFIALSPMIFCPVFHSFGDQTDSVAQKGIYHFILGLFWGSQRVVGLPNSMLKAPFLFSFLSFGGS